MVARSGRGSKTGRGLGLTRNPNSTPNLRGDSSPNSKLKVDSGEKEEENNGEDGIHVAIEASFGENMVETEGRERESLQIVKILWGEIEAVVIATGIHTFFGKAAHLVDSTNNVGHFQKVLTAIGNFCICSIALGMIIEKKFEVITQLGLVLILQQRERE